ncbi:hypothetical protein GCM10007392_23450 [Saccharospirillum salsuginis]|uniref:PilC beta-propeller domain-containing protein n=2 Tax=Saccharospirillum salsuginis TaxID=418750 RepID=A0A918K937_9GAMM|nr:hypothetical protein GCM10007392_23450 [Saccharospirillum salsuginis]
MLGLSVDHQLYYKAYSDYTDLNGDGIIDTTYLDDFEYRGYFNPELCYKYDSTDKNFQATSESDPRMDEDLGKTVTYSCHGDEWSGNFLNWATMTRIDMLRSVLYGGMRSTDTDSSTVLERSHLPKDVHSFAKVVHQWDSTTHTDSIPWYHILPDGYSSGSITMCNTSDSNDVPEIRIVSGVYETWASKEGTQCQYESDSASAPSTDERVEDLVARVEVCEYSSEKSDETRCRLYKDSNDVSYYKPYGLLQRYGEDGRIEFGLITGSYHQNLDGGVIRKTISKIGGNETAADDEIDLSTGQLTAVEGVISTLDTLKIAKYPVNNKYGDCNSPGITLDEIKGNTAQNHCSNWGNPVAEIYYEALRYFSGQSNALGEFSDNNSNGENYNEDTDFISGLVSQFSWEDPFDSSNYCSRCSIIMLSSGTPSFDGLEEEWSSRLSFNGSDPDVIGLDSGTALFAKTKQVGDVEYDNLNGQFISASNGNCVPTTVDDLSEVTGLCPDSPQVEGGYQIAGLAFHAKTTDLRTDFEGMQTVNTYAIELGESVPAIEFNADGKLIRLVPTCQSKNGGDAETDEGYLGCSLYNMIVRSASYAEDGDLLEASYIIFWEDSLWGNDYDLDGAQRLYVCTGALNSCDVDSDQFKITQQWVYTAAGFRLRSSYAVSGSTEDGLNTEWTIKDGTDVDSGNNPNATVYGFDEDDTPIARKTRTYSVNKSGTAVTLLRKPLYLAAKFGGFTDINQTGTPDKVEEWDRLNNETGAAGADGIPDQYYQVRNPTNLTRQLGRVFASIIERVASGSNAAVVANRSTGNGAIYQALYYPSVSKGENTVTWVGQVHSLFVDEAGLVREDTNGNGILDDYPTTAQGDNPQGDFIVDIYYDEDSDDTYFQRYVRFDASSVTQPDGSSGDLTDFAFPYGSPELVNKLKTVWNVAEELAEISDANIIDQRDLNLDGEFSESAGSYRYLFTTTEQACPNDATATCTVETDLVSTNASTLSRYMGFDPSDSDQLAETVGIINYVRGLEISGLRSRSIDMDDDGSAETWRMGDVVHSTPVVVERPNSRYDTRLGDHTYAVYREQYKERRRMIYVGANDGTIRGINGGYWNAVCNGFFKTSLQPDATTGEITCQDPTPTGSEVQHPLGSEMFAYVPQNLLPHLKWQAEVDYPHVYYMDGEPLVFDARIFDDDDDHPNGWGTVLVMGMRQGGGPMSLDHDGDTNTPDKTFRSSYVVLDVTNPEKPPKVLDEISHANLGYTFSKPALVKRYVRDAETLDNDGNLVSGGFKDPLYNQWSLIFGNGPTDMNAGTSNQNASAFAFELDGTSDAPSTASRLQRLELSNATNGMALGFTVTDWDRDGIDDAAYFGTTRGTIANQTGEVYRMRTSDSANTDVMADISTADTTLMLESQKPVVVTPSTSRSSTGERWIHFGTGRFYANDDRTTQDQQSMYGVVEPILNGSFTWGSVAVSDLVETSGIKVYDNGSVKNSAGGTLQIDSEDVTDYEALKSAILGQGGWKRQLTSSNGTSPSGRVIREATQYLDQLIFTEYLPSADQCDVNGRSNLYVLGWESGTPLPYDPLNTSGTADTDTDGDGNADASEVSGAVDAGVGEFTGGNVFETITDITLVNDQTTIDGLEDGTISVDDYSDQQLTGDNCVFVQSSTGAMVCIRVGAPEVAGTGRQSWRELRILF